MFSGGVTIYTMYVVWNLKVQCTKVVKPQMYCTRTSLLLLCDVRNPFPFSIELFKERKPDVFWKKKQV